MTGLTPPPVPTIGSDQEALEWWMSLWDSIAGPLSAHERMCLETFLPRWGKRHRLDGPEHAWLTSFLKVRPFSILPGATQAPLSDSSQDPKDLRWWAETKELLAAPETRASFFSHLGLYDSPPSAKDVKRDPVGLLTARNTHGGMWTHDDDPLRWTALCRAVFQNKLPQWQEVLDRVKNDWVIFVLSTGFTPAFGGYCIEGNPVTFCVWPKVEGQSLHSLVTQNGYSVHPSTLLEHNESALALAQKLGRLPAIDEFFPIKQVALSPLDLPRGNHTLIRLNPENPLESALLLTKNTSGRGVQARVLYKKCNITVEAGQWEALLSLGLTETDIGRNLVALLEAGYAKPYACLTVGRNRNLIFQELSTCVLDLQIARGEVLQTSTMRVFAASLLKKVDELMATTKRGLSFGQPYIKIDRKHEEKTTFGPTTSPPTKKDILISFPNKRMSGCFPGEMSYDQLVGYLFAANAFPPRRILRQKTVAPSKNLGSR